MSSYIGVYERYSDEELLEAIKSSNYSAFAEIYARYADKLYRYAGKIQLDEGDKEDIIQEVFSSLWTRRLTCNIETLSAWLYMSVRKQALYLLRKKKYQDKYIQSVVDFASPFYDPILGVIQEKQVQAYLDDEIAKLSPRAKEVFTLSRYEYLSHKEIGEKLGIAESSVRKQIQQVLKIFRYKLGRDLIQGILFILFY